MAATESFREYIVEQLEDAGRITWRKMFGAFCLYCDGKPVAFIADDRLLVKPTGAGRAYIGEPEETELFPGSRLWFSVEDRCDDREWLAGLVRITADELPAPKPRTKKAGGKRKYLME